MRGRPLLLLVLSLGLAGAEGGDRPNGFDVSGLRVPRELVRAAASRRDPVPCVDEPRFVRPEEAIWVAPNTPVVGVALGGEAHAYPVHVLEYHPLVADVLGGVPVLVSFDPLTAAPRAWRRVLDGKTLEFGLSGLVFNSGLLLYDRGTGSLWSQFRGDAVAGPLAGRRLEPVRVRQEPMARWFERHPETRVLERPEPKRIDYRYSPYKAYWIEDRIPHPVQARDESFHAKEVVLGVEVAGRARAYLGSLVRAGGLHVEDEIAGRRLILDYDPDEAVFSWEAPEDLRVTDSYWFAWKAFHPETEVWRPPEPRAE
jgi:hypothetical protein